MFWWFFHKLIKLRFSIEQTHDNEPIPPVPWYFVKLRFHCSMFSWKIKV